MPPSSVEVSSPATGSSLVEEVASSGGVGSVSPSPEDVDEVLSGALVDELSGAEVDEGAEVVGEEGCVLLAGGGVAEPEAVGASLVEPSLAVAEVEGVPAPSSPSGGA